MEDPDIIDLYWERSENAISETDAKYKSLCMHVASNILHDTSDAEECLNDTYLAAWNTIPSKRPKYFPAFLCRIVRNLALKRLEHNSAKKRNPEILLSLDELDDCIPSGEDVEKSFDSAELGRTISCFLRSQPRRNRVIFLRRYWYYDSIAAIAKNFGMTENAVKQLLFRMRGQLKKHLESEGSL
jgi:RNA polymerase sigma-70 factor (ECF subfamily)